MLRKIALIFAMFLPGPLKRAYYRTVFGWRMGRRCRIGFSYIDARDVRLGTFVRIGHFNVIRNVRVMTLREGTFIGNFNHIYGAAGEDFPSVLFTGRWVNIMSHHFFDVAGELLIRDGATIGGRDTHVYTHSLKVVDGAEQLVPTKIIVGKQAYTGARCTLLAASIPARATVGATATVTKSFVVPKGQRVLIAGNPAAIRKVYED